MNLDSEMINKRIDGQLKEALDNINRHIDVLHDIEKDFLFVDGNKKAMLATFIMKESVGSFAMREAKALASADWIAYSSNHAALEADYNRAKRRYELLLKHYDACHLSLKSETSAIKRQVG